MPEQSRTGRMLSRLEREEMALQQDMRERGRRLRRALARKSQEVRDGWTARLLPRDDLPAPRFAA